MRWATRLIAGAEPVAALEISVEGLRDELGGEPDLLLAFVAAEDAATYRQVMRALEDTFPRALSLGCSAAGVIAAHQELEWEPAVSLAAARLPGVALHPLRLSTTDLPPPDAPADAYARLLGPAGVDPACLLLLTDPMGFDPNPLLEGLDFALPTTAKLGGVASNLPDGAGPALWIDGALHARGAVGVALSGDLRVETLVAQGCKPVGQPLFVTRCQPHLIQELDGRPPLEVLQEVLATLSIEDLQLARRSLFLGVAMSPTPETPGPGDYLVRNLLGVEQSSGGLAVAARLDRGAVVQLHLRDAAASTYDLEAVLDRGQAALGGARPSGALLFSCLGRGKGLYGEPGHDSRLFAEHLGEVPLAGFFGNGEIGPVQRRTFLHGYTSAFGLFLPRK